MAAARSAQPFNQCRFAHINFSCLPFGFGTNVAQLRVSVALTRCGVGNAISQRIARPLNRVKDFGNTFGHSTGNVQYPGWLGNGLLVSGLRSGT
jgi:hypothetical protein